MNSFHLQTSLRRRVKFNDRHQWLFGVVINFVKPDQLVIAIGKQRYTKPYSQVIFI